MARCTHIIGRVSLIAIGLLIAEGLLRLLPSPIQYPEWHEYGDPDSLLGIEMVPSTKKVERSSCYTANITTNSSGWRDKERTIDRIPDLGRIAVLGDSFMAGSQVNDAETFSGQLESILGEDKVEVLNFGLSSIGTVQEDILYEYVVSEYDPDIVILSLYSNDIYNNHPRLDGGEEKRTRLTYRDENGNLMHFRTKGTLYGFRKWLRVHSAFYRLVKASHGRVRQLISRITTAMPEEDIYPGYPSEFFVYEPPINDVWREAWGITEQTLLSLRDRIEPQRKFYLLLVPNILQFASDPASLIRDEYGIDPPENFDPLYPHNRLLAFAAQEGIRIIDPLPTFLAYRKEHNLSFPWFFFECDGHWNQLGHTLAAEEAYRNITFQENSL